MYAYFFFLVSNIGIEFKNEALLKLALGGFNTQNQSIFLYYNRVE